MSNAPDFRKFGINSYRSKLVQRGNTVTISQRSWLGAIALALFGAIPGFFSLLPMVMKGDYDITFDRALLLALFVLLEIGALLCALYRDEIFFDFGAGRYRFRNGFFWNIRETRGSFDDIETVTVRERIQSTDSRHHYKTYSIGIECRRGGEPTDFWKTLDGEKAKYISGVLARAFDAKVVWGTSPAEMAIRRSSSRGKGDAARKGRTS